MFYVAGYYNENSMGERKLEGDPAYHNDQVMEYEKSSTKKRKRRLNTDRNNEKDSTKRTIKR